MQSNSKQQAAAKPAVDPGRWQQQVRLECLKVAAMRVEAAKAAYDTDALLRVAGRLENFVVKGS
jgi:hypothetical protein